jgi:anthranilate phosphoribosyltransferase
VSNINPPLNDNIFATVDGLLQGKINELLESAIWNGGFYLWHCGVATDLKAGMAQAQELLVSGRVRQQLQLIITKISG